MLKILEDKNMNTIVHTPEELVIIRFLLYPTGCKKKLKYQKKLPI